MSPSGRSGRAGAHSLVASPFKSAYVSAKHGIVGFTKTIALESAAEVDRDDIVAVAPAQALEFPPGMIDAGRKKKDKNIPREGKA